MSFNLPLSLLKFTQIIIIFIITIPQHFTQQVTHYMSKLAELNFDLIYKPGATNHADTLSCHSNIDKGNNDNDNVTVLPDKRFVHTIESLLLKPMFGIPNLKIIPLWNNRGVNTRLRKIPMHIGRKQMPLLSQKMTNYEEISYTDIITTH